MPAPSPLKATDGISLCIAASSFVGSAQCLTGKCPLLPHDYANAAPQKQQQRRFCVLGFFFSFLLALFVYFFLLRLYIVVDVSFFTSIFMLTLPLPMSSELVACIEMVHPQVTAASIAHVVLWTFDPLLLAEQDRTDLTTAVSSHVTATLLQFRQSTEATLERLLKTCFLLAL